MPRSLTTKAGLSFFYLPQLVNKITRYSDNLTFNLFKQYIREIDFCTLVNFGKKCLKKHIDKGQKNNFDIFTSIFVISMWKNHVLFSHRYNFLILSFKRHCLRKSHDSTKSTFSDRLEMFFSGSPYQV